MAMFILNVKLAMACIILLPFLTIAMFYIEIHSRKRWEVFRNKRSNLNGFTHEDFSGIKVVQAFANEKNTEKNFRKMVKEQKEAFLNAVRLNDCFWPLVELSWGIGTLIVLAVGYRLILSREIQVGKLIAFSMYTGMFWRPIMNLSSFYNTLITNFAAADRIFDILDQDPDIENIGEAPKMSRIDGKVEFRNIDFSYNVGGKVLNNINFKVNSGDRIALVGATGSGKTTIISLLSRFYDPTNGEILVDGKNIKYVDLYSYRSQMGIMLQDTFLFSSTIMENIRYGRLDASDEDVIAAAELANADHFIKHLPEGYDTVITGDGGNLSQGQRQLLAIARAAIADPPVLILDEATSALDNVTEKIIQDSLEKLCHGRTTIVVAHRLSTIKNADEIAVMGNTGIIEKGSHEELLKSGGEYSRLHKISSF